MTFLHSMPRHGPGERRGVSPAVDSRHFFQKHAWTASLQTSRMLCLVDSRWNKSEICQQSGKHSVRKRFLIVCLKYGLGLGLLAYAIWRNWAPASGQGLQAVVQRHFIEGEPLHTGPFML